MIIGITGHKRNGKDTFVDFCVDYLKESDIPVFREAFANPLKHLVKSMLSKEVTYIFKMSDSEIKSSNYIVENIDIDVLNFHLLVNEIPLLTEDEIKNILEVKEKYLGIVYRYLLQYVGTEIIRKRNKMFWINIMYNYINELRKNNDNFVLFITDVRFMNEAYLIKMFDGFIVHIFRPDFQNNDDHESERYIDKISKFLGDIKIVNDGTLEDLKKEAINFCKVIINLLNRG